MRRQRTFASLLLAALVVPLLLGARAVFAQADGENTLTYPVDSVPPEILLRRGAQLIFTGEGEKNSRGSIVLRAGRSDYSKSTLAGNQSWRVIWNTRGETGTVFTLSIVQIRPDLSEVMLSRAFVQLYDASLVSLAHPRDGSPVDDATELRISYNGRIPAERIQVLMDGKVVQDVPLKDGPYRLQTSGIKPGRHELRARLHLARGAGISDTTPITVDVKSKVMLLPLPLRGVFDLRQSADNVPQTIPLRTTISEDLAPTAQAVTFLLDGTEIGRSEQPPFDGIVLSPHTMTAGERILTATLKTKDGRQFLSQEVKVSILRHARRELEEWRKGVNDAEREVLPHMESYAATVARFREKPDTLVDLKEGALRLKEAHQKAASALGALRPPIALSEGQRNRLEEVARMLANAHSANVLRWDRESQMWSRMIDTHVDAELALARFVLNQIGQSIGKTRDQRDAESAKTATITIEAIAGELNPPD